MRNLSSVCVAENKRSPVRCPYCGKTSAVWAETDAHAAGLWVKCKNPACRKEFEIKK